MSTPSGLRTRAVAALANHRRRMRVLDELERRIHVLDELQHRLPMLDQLNHVVTTAMTFDEMGPHDVLRAEVESLAAYSATIARAIELLGQRLDDVTQRLDDLLLRPGAATVSGHRDAVLRTDPSPPAVTAPPVA